MTTLQKRIENYREYQRWQPLPDSDLYNVLATFAQIDIDTETAQQRLDDITDRRDVLQRQTVLSVNTDLDELPNIASAHAQLDLLDTLQELTQAALLAIDERGSTPARKLGSITKALATSKRRYDDVLLLLAKSPNIADTDEYTAAERVYRQSVKRLTGRDLDGAGGNDV